MEYSNIMQRISYNWNFNKFYKQEDFFADENFFKGNIRNNIFFSKIGLSGVRALPLAAGTNEGGHYFRYFSSFFVLFLLPPLFKTTEGVVVLFQIFAWANKKNNK